MKELFRNIWQASEERLAVYAERTASSKREAFKTARPTEYNAEAEAENQRLREELHERAAAQLEAADVIERLAEREKTLDRTVKFLRIRDVKTTLLAKFHSDRHPDADAKQRNHLDEMLKVLNEVYEEIERW